MDARGGQALLVCRFLPVLRTVAPYLAGAVSMPYERIAPYSFVGALLWSSGESGAGYLVTASAGHLAGIGAPAVAAVTAAVILLGLIGGLRRRRRDWAPSAPTRPTGE